MNTSVPVLTFHSIATHPENRPWSFLSTPVEMFEAHLRYLSDCGYKSVSLADLYKAKTIGWPLPDKPVVLTFDDGFLDNWVFAAPLLKKFNMQATVFVTPEFVDRQAVVRPTLEEVWKGHCSPSDLQWWGYASWAELKLMQESGIFDVQAHGLTHTWYPCSEKLVDFHHPGDSYYWLWWNRYPDRKPYWLTQFDEQEVPWGSPVHQYGKSLTARRYKPNPLVEETCTQFVRGKGGTSFFRRPRSEWSGELHRMLAQRFAGNLGGEWESEEEYRSRITIELSLGKTEIERNIGHEVWFIAWPGGGVNNTTRNIALSLGYRAWTSKGKPSNMQGDSPEDVFRVAGWLGLMPPSALQSPVERAFLRVQLDRAQLKQPITFITAGLRSINRDLRSIARRYKGENA